MKKFVEEWKNKNDFVFLGIMLKIEGEIMDEIKEKKWKTKIGIWGKCLKNNKMRINII